MALDYIKKDAGDIFSFPSAYDDYRQTFDHDFSMSKGRNESVEVKLFAQTSNEFAIGLVILRHIYRFRFITYDQLYRLLKLSGIDDSEILNKILEKYIERRLINKFCLSEAPLSEIPDDAMLVYCMDHGAKFILQHFPCEEMEMISAWKTSDCMYSGSIVFKCLMTNEFYISMYEVKGTDTAIFEPLADFMIGGRPVRLSGWLRLKSDKKTDHFLIETIRKSDLPLAWEKKVDTHLTPFIHGKNGISRYFNSDPKWIFVTDSQDSAMEIADIFERMAVSIDPTKNIKYRLVTSEELRKGLDRAIFYKYDGGMLKPVRSIFAK